MKNTISILQSAISLTLAVLFLAANVGVTIGSHYCGGEKVESKIMLASHNLDCGMANMATDCKHHKQNSKNQFSKPCCENEFDFFQVEQEYEQPNFTDQIDLNFLVAFIQTSIQLVNIENKEQHFLNYSPPLIKKDLQVLHQSFLI